MSSYTDQWVEARSLFRVTIDGNQLSFQEVTGLDLESQVIEYRHGDSPSMFNIKRGGMQKFSDIVLKKGVFKTGSEITDIFNLVYEHQYMTTTEGRFDTLIELLDETEETVMSWNLHNCIPIKLSINGFKSDANEASIEEITLSVEQITVAF